MLSYRQNNDEDPPLDKPLFSDREPPQQNLSLNLELLNDQQDSQFFHNLDNSFKLDTLRQISPFNFKKQDILSNDFEEQLLTHRPIRQKFDSQKMKSLNLTIMKRQTFSNQLEQQNESKNLSDTVLNLECSQLIEIDSEEKNQLIQREKEFIEAALQKGITRVYLWYVIQFEKVSAIDRLYQSVQSQIYQLYQEAFKKIQVKREQQEFTSMQNYIMEQINKYVRELYWKVYSQQERDDQIAKLKKKELERKCESIMQLVQTEIKCIYNKALKQIWNKDEDQCQTLKECDSDVHLRMNEIYKELQEEVVMLYEDAVDQIKRKKRRQGEEQERIQTEIQDERKTEQQKVISQLYKRVQDGVRQIYYFHEMQFERKKVVAQLKEKENSRRVQRYYEELKDEIVDLYEQALEKIKQRKKDKINEVYSILTQGIKDLYWSTVVNNERKKIVQNLKSKENSRRAELLYEDIKEEVANLYLTIVEKNKIKKIIMEKLTNYIKFTFYKAKIQIRMKKRITQLYFKYLGEIKMRRIKNQPGWDEMQDMFSFQPTISRSKSTNIDQSKKQQQTQGQHHLKKAKQQNQDQRTRDQPGWDDMQDMSTNRSKSTTMYPKQQHHLKKPKQQNQDYLDQNHLPPLKSKNPRMKKGKVQHLAQMSKTNYQINDSANNINNQYFQQQRTSSNSLIKPLYQIDEQQHRLPNNNKSHQFMIQTQGSYRNYRSQPHLKNIVTIGGNHSNLIVFQGFDQNKKPKQRDQKYFKFMKQQPSQKNMKQIQRQLKYITTMRFSNTLSDLGNLRKDFIQINKNSLSEPPNYKRRIQTATQRDFQNQANNQFSKANGPIISKTTRSLSPAKLKQIEENYYRTKYKNFDFTKPQNNYANTQQLDPYQPNLTLQSSKKFLLTNKQKHKAVPFYKQQLDKLTIQQRKSASFGLASQQANNNELFKKTLDTPMFLDINNKREAGKLNNKKVLKKVQNKKSNNIDLNTQTVMDASQTQLEREITPGSQHPFERHITADGSYLGLEKQITEEEPLINDQNDQQARGIDITDQLQYSSKVVCNNDKSPYNQRFMNSNKLPNEQQKNDLVRQQQSEKQQEEEQDEMAFEMYNKIRKRKIQRSYTDKGTQQYQHQFSQPYSNAETPKITKKQNSQALMIQSRTTSKKINSFAGSSQPGQTSVKGETISIADETSLNYSHRPSIISNQKGSQIYPKLFQHNSAAQTIQQQIQNNNQQQNTFNQAPSQTAGVASVQFDLTYQEENNEQMINRIENIQQLAPLAPKEQRLKTFIGSSNNSPLHQVQQFDVSQTLQIQNQQYYNQQQNEQMIGSNQQQEEPKYQSPIQSSSHATNIESQVILMQHMFENIMVKMEQKNQEAIEQNQIEIQKIYHIINELNNNHQKNGQQEQPPTFTQQPGQEGNFGLPGFTDKPNIKRNMQPNIQNNAQNKSSVNMSAVNDSNISSQISSRRRPANIGVSQLQSQQENQEVAQINQPLQIKIQAQDGLSEIESRDDLESVNQTILPRTNQALKKQQTQISQSDAQFLNVKNNLQRKSTQQMNNMNFMQKPPSSRKSSSKRSRRNSNRMSRGKINILGGVSTVAPGGASPGGSFVSRDDEDFSEGLILEDRSNSKDNKNNHHNESWNIRDDPSLNPTLPLPKNNPFAQYHDIQSNSNTPKNQGSMKMLTTSKYSSKESSFNESKAYNLYQNNVQFKGIDNVSSPAGDETLSKMGSQIDFTGLHQLMQIQNQKANKKLRMAQSEEYGSFQQQSSPDLGQKELKQLEERGELLSNTQQSNNQARTEEDKTMKSSNLDQCF